MLSHFNMGDYFEKEFHYKCFAKKIKTKQTWRTVMVYNKKAKFVSIKINKLLAYKVFSGHNYLSYEKALKLDLIHAYVPEKNIISNANKHIGRDFIYKFDITKFFQSITEQDVIQVLYKGFAEESTKFEFLTKDIAKLCCVNGSLVLGSPLSPLISNLFMSDFDLALNDFCLKNNFVYTRYADDITISSVDKKFDLAFIENQVQDILDRVFYSCSTSFALNSKKSKLLSPHQAQIITGVQINNGVLSIPKRNMRLYKLVLNLALKKGIEAAEDFYANNVSPIGNAKEYLLGYHAFGRQIYTGNDIRDGKLFDIETEKKIERL